MTNEVNRHLRGWSLCVILRFTLIGQAIREARAKKGLTQAELAGRVGLTRQHINNIEQNRGDIPLGTAVKIAHALEMVEIVVAEQDLVIIRGDAGEALVRHAIAIADRLDDAAQSISAARALIIDTSAQARVDGVLSQFNPPAARGRDELAAIPPQTEALGQIRTFAPTLTASVIRDAPSQRIPGMPFDYVAGGEMIEVAVHGYVAAGEPIEEGATDETVLVPRYLLGEGEELLRARGQSMIEWGIDDGDYVVVQWRTVAATGELVIAWYQDGITVKQWFNKGGVRQLIAGNPESLSYTINEGDVFDIRAAVVGVWKPRDKVIGAKQVPAERRPNRRK